MTEEWVSVTRELPAERIEVLVTLVWIRDDAVFCHPKVIQASLRWGKWQDNTNHPICDVCWGVTHWMPMPQPAGEEA